MPGMRPSFAQKSLLRLLPSTWCGAVDAPQRNPGASSVIVECLPDANSYHVVGFRWNVDRDRQAGKGAGWFRNLSVTLTSGRVTHSSHRRAEPRTGGDMRRHRSGVHRVQGVSVVGMGELDVVAFHAR